MDPPDRKSLHRGTLLSVIPDGPGADPWADPSKQQAQ